MTRAGRASDEHRCPSCRARILTQLVGRIAALNVTADLTPLTAAQQVELREPNRLIWCLVTTALGTHRLRWTGSLHPATCPHDHVTEHRCTTRTEPTTLF